jgi:hypothetical protein
MSGQLSKAMLQHAHAGREAVGFLKRAWHITLITILGLGISGIVLQRRLGENLADIAHLLLIQAEQAVSFQSAVFDARRIAEVNAGISSFHESIDELHHEYVHFALVFHDLQQSLVAAESQFGKTDGNLHAISNVYEIVEPATDPDATDERFSVSLLEMGEYLGALLFPLQNMDPSNISFSLREMELLLANDIAYENALNYTVSIRLHDVQESFKNAELLIGLLGLGCFVVVVAGGAGLVMQQLSALRYKAVHVVDLVVFVPRKVAKALRGRTQSKLSKVIAEQEGEEEDDEEGMNQVLAEEHTAAVIQDMR